MLSIPARLQKLGTDSKADGRIFLQRTRHIQTWNFWFYYQSCLDFAKSLLD